MALTHIKESHRTNISAGAEVLLCPSCLNESVWHDATPHDYDRDGFRLEMRPWRGPDRECSLCPAKHSDVPARGVIVSAVRSVLALLVLALLPSFAQAEPLIISQSAFAVVQGLDLHSTYLAVSRGHGREVNTWALGPGFGAKALVAKSLSTVLVVTASSYFDRRGQRKTARVMNWTLTAVTGLIAWRNYEIANGPR